MKGTVSVEEALRSRRSRRRFAAGELSAPVVGQMLWAGQGITDDAGHRSAPSAGARYPIELYAVSPSKLMHYRPDTHSIEQRDDVSTLQALPAAAFDQDFVGAAPITFVITGAVARTEVEYGALAQDLMNREAGHVAQNMLLQATALDLHSVPVGGFDPARIARLMALPIGEEVLYVMPVGLRPA